MLNYFHEGSGGERERERGRILVFDMGLLCSKIFRVIVK